MIWLFSTILIYIIANGLEGHRDQSFSSDNNEEFSRDEEEKDSEEDLSRKQFV